VFARELLQLGPWRTQAALRRAHQRGVLVEHQHWDWMGGLRVYYLERIVPGLFTEVKHDEAQATAERLRGVLAHLTPRRSAS
jgi:hypothetical protein